MKLWVRLGDMSEYEEFGDDLYAVASTLHEAGLKTITRCLGGVEASGDDEYCSFYGRNYISLFWGDNHASMLRQLTVAEIAELQRIVTGLNEKRQVSH